MIEIIILIIAIGMIGPPKLAIDTAIISDNMKEIENITSERTKREQTQRKQRKQ